MDIQGTKRLNHLDVVMGVIKELGVIDRIDKKLGQHDQTYVTGGEAVAAMVLS